MGWPVEEMVETIPDLLSIRERFKLWEADNLTLDGR